ncbi:MAG: NAD(P)-binding protein, partial [Deltaproteobacteria bacterium]|nr:NAD(P)-binding protein [Deltaproteobacteria bacterium]
MPSNKKKFVILGAGPCGLGAAWRLQELGINDYEIFEKNDYVGGLSASFVDDKGF